MRKKDYCNLLAALDVSCWVWDEGRKTGRSLGGGETKLFLASKS